MGTDYERVMETIFKPVQCILKSVKIRAIRGQNSNEAPCNFGIRVQFPNILSRVNPVTAANQWNEESVPRFDTHDPPVPPLSPLRHIHSSAWEASHRVRAKIPIQLFRLGNSSATGKSARARSSSLPFHRVA
jgi:hypothetical protein